MSNNHYDDYDRPPRRSRRAPDPAAYDDYDRDEPSSRRSRRPARNNSEMPPASDTNIPPPPMGPALKRSGSRSRLPRDARPEFPDEASYLGPGAPDLERKDRREDRRFREKREGYTSDEGEVHKRGGAGRRGGERERRYEEEEEGYEEEPPPRRRSRRSGPEGVEYGAAPIRRSRTDRDRPSRRERDRYDDYSSDDDDDSRPPPRRSDRDRRGKRGDDPYDDRGYRSDELDRRDRDARKRREGIYDRDRDDRRRGDRDRDRDRRQKRPSSYDDRYDDYDDRDRDRRRSGRGDRERDRAPTEMKIGKYDVGPWIDKGQKHWGTLAPIVTPLVMNMIKERGKR